MEVVVTGQTPGRAHKMKIAVIIFLTLSSSLLLCSGRTLTEHILDGIRYKAAKASQLLDVTRDTAEDIIDIKKNTLTDILGPINQIFNIKKSAISNIVGRASTALSSIVNIKRDVIRHKVEQISDLLSWQGSQCKTVEEEVTFSVTMSARPV